MRRPRSRSCVSGRAAAAAAIAGLLALGADRAVATWLPEVPITAAGIETEIGLNHTPLVYDPEGGLTVAWAQRDTPQQNFQIYARRRAWSVFTLAALIVPYDDSQPGSLLGAKFPSLAVLGDSVFVAWHDYRHGGIFNSEIYARMLALDGSLGTQLRLTTTDNESNPGDNGYVPTVVRSASGEMHVVWYDFRWDPNRADIFAKRRLTNGAWITALGDSADVNVSRGVAQGGERGRACHRSGAGWNGACRVGGCAPRRAAAPPLALRSGERVDGAGDGACAGGAPRGADGGGRWGRHAPRRMGRCTRRRRPRGSTCGAGPLPDRSERSKSSPIRTRTPAIPV